MVLYDFSKFPSQGPNKSIKNCGIISYMHAAICKQKFFCLFVCFAESCKADFFLVMRFSGKDSTDGLED